MSAIPPQLADTGITYRQLDHWIRRGYLTVAGAHRGTGNVREWTDGELAVARRMVLLVAAGFRPEVAGEVARLIHAEGSSYPVTDHVTVTVTPTLTPKVTPTDEEVIAQLLGHAPMQPSTQRIIDSLVGGDEYGSP